MVLPSKQVGQSSKRDKEAIEAAGRINYSSRSRRTSNWYLIPKDRRWNSSQNAENSPQWCLRVLWFEEATTAKYCRPLGPALLLSINPGLRFGAFDLAFRRELLLPRRLTLSWGIPQIHCFMQYENFSTPERLVVTPYRARWLGMATAVLQLNQHLRIISTLIGISKRCYSQSQGTRLDR